MFASVIKLCKANIYNWSWMLYVGVLDSVGQIVLFVLILKNIYPNNCKHESKNAKEQISLE